MNLSEKQKEVINENQKKLIKFIKERLFKFFDENPIIFKAMTSGYKFQVWIQEGETERELEIKSNVIAEDGSEVTFEELFKNE